MRSLRLVLVVLASTASVASAEEVVQLTVGETRTGFGTVRPMCDAPRVAIIEAGVLKGVGPGETICSVATVQAQGTRRVVRVVVSAVAPEKPPAPAEDGDRTAPRELEAEPSAR